MNLTLFDICAVASLGLWLLVLHLTRSRGSKNGYSLPPGPKGLPLVGNYFDLPKSHDWMKAADWGRQYGELVYVDVFGSKSLFVNSYAAAVELLEKRSSIYSSRPHLPMALELEEWGWKFSMMPYGERWKKHRTYFQRFFQPSAIPQYMDLETREAHALLYSMLQSPDSAYSNVRRIIGGIVMQIAYGHEVKEDNDHYVQIADNGLRALGQVLVKGRFLVDYFPILKYLPEWVPGARFKNVAAEGYKLSKAMWLEPHAMTKEKVLNGTARPSMTSELIESNVKNDGTIEDEDVIAAVTGIAYSGGTDTVVSTLLTFLHAIALNPNVQKRAQEELDRIVGTDSLPSFEDRANLPYVNAVCMETLRYEAVVPLSISHCTTEDDVYNGYYIPADTTILPNIWAMLRDPSIYPDPDSFFPERWLPKDGKELPIHPNKISFGFGRRICPGRHLAEDLIFIVIASILAAFDIAPPGDEEGNRHLLERKYMESFIRHPDPFRCSITPRSEKLANVIRDSAESVGNL